ncbi:MAG: TraR/DksA C4-type zinc finger protein [Geopsychrobacter sp.]|nr:TraR/DksA C4-type zinc finger protein [Geopsychrobacter sp.]
MEEITAEQIGTLRVLIQLSCAELQALLENSRASSKPVALDEPIGRLSRMDALQHQQMAVASRQIQSQRLQLLRNALKAIERDEYGNCRRCEEPIGYQRLKVRPESPFCLACQSRSERS